jgi:hypothetical protein
MSVIFANTPVVSAMVPWASGPPDATILDTTAPYDSSGSTSGNLRVPAGRLEESQSDSDSDSASYHSKSNYKKK